MSEVIDIKQVRELTTIAKGKKMAEADHVLTVNSYIVKAAEKGMCGITIRVPKDIAHKLSELYTSAGYTISVERDHKDTCIVKIDWRIDYI